MPRGLTLCHGVAGIQYALAIGSLALGHVELAGAFFVFALVQTFPLIVRRCGWSGACESTPVDPAAPERGTTPRPVS